MLKANLISKYKQIKSKDEVYYYLNLLINFTPFQDIEYVLQCIKEMEYFFNNDKSYGGKFILNFRFQSATYQSRIWDLTSLTDSLNKMTEILEDDIFENYSWNHDEDNKLDILMPILETIKRFSHEIHIFTTNYDTSIEEYCSKNSNKCIDGFEYNDYYRKRIWTGKYEQNNINDSNNVYLYKLPGSLNWKYHIKYKIVLTNEESKSIDPNYTDNLLIYPTLCPKDGMYKEPFKTIRSKFKEFMENADICIIIGFSFRDEHINEIFYDFFNHNKILVVISPSADKNTIENFLKEKLDNEKPTLIVSNNNNVEYSYIKNDRIALINQGINENNIQNICKTL